MAKPSKPAAAAQPSKPVARTEVRNSPIPQMAPPPRPTAAKTPPPRAAAPQSAAPAPAAARPAAVKQVTHELVARRAYEIWASGQGGSEMENWIRAERELRGI
jgi:hypothetical protein